MKKIFIFVSILFLSGCVNGNRDFETICTKKEESNGFIENLKYKVYSNSENKITKIEEIYNLTSSSEAGNQTFDAAKMAIDSYSKSKNYEVKVVKDDEFEYEVKLVLDVKNLTDEQLDEYDIRRNYKNHLNNIKKEMKCD